MFYSNHSFWNYCSSRNCFKVSCTPEVISLKGKFPFNFFFYWSKIVKLRYLFLISFFHATYTFWMMSACCIWPLGASIPNASNAKRSFPCYSPLLDSVSIDDCRRQCASIQMPAMPGDLFFWFSLLLDDVSIGRWLLKEPPVCRCSTHSTDACKSSDLYSCYYLFWMITAKMVPRSASSVPPL